MQKTENLQQLCLHMKTDFKIKTVESEESFSYIVSVVLDIILDDVVLFLKYSGRFRNFFNSDSKDSKLEIMQWDIFSTKIPPRWSPKKKSY